MSTHCLICDSTAVISKDAAKAIALLICTLNGFLRAALQPRHSQPKPPMCDSPVEQAFNLMLDGVAGAMNSWTDSQAFIRDVQQYQFIDYDCLCLRCGAIQLALVKPSLTGLTHSLLSETDKAAASCLFF